jgi:hypothetical protein
MASVVEGQFQHMFVEYLIKFEDSNFNNILLIFENIMKIILKCLESKAYLSDGVCVSIMINVIPIGHFLSTCGKML